MWVIPRYLYTRSPPNRMLDTSAQVSGGGGAVIPLRSGPATIAHYSCALCVSRFSQRSKPSPVRYIRHTRFIRSGQGYTPLSSSLYTAAGVNCKRFRSEMTSRYMLGIRLMIRTILYV